MLKQNAIEIANKAALEEKNEISVLNHKLERIGSEVYLDLFPDKQDSNLSAIKKLEEISATRFTEPSSRT